MTIVSKNRSTFVALSLFAFLAAPATPAMAQQGTAPTTKEGSKMDATVTTLKKIDTKPGSGAEAVAGKSVAVHYTGWLYDERTADKHGEKFDSSLDRGEPFAFNLGEKQVIRGWDEGVAGMKVGGKRTLMIPAEYGYGNRRTGPIPAGSSLVFDVELLDVQPR